MTKNSGVPIASRWRVRAWSLLTDAGGETRNIVVQRRNPFPGIDPWMQTAWSDVHTLLIAYVRDALSDELPDDLLARAEENISLCGPDDGERGRRADVAVVEPEAWKSGRRPLWTPSDDPELADRVAEPVVIEVDEVVNRWVEIRSAKGRLITVIEVTSPSNKTPGGRSDFEHKIRTYLEGGVNVMEIDLVRGGESARDRRGGKWPRESCGVVVNRAWDPRHCEVYPCPLREPLPAVRVPLRPEEPDAALDLQPLIDRCYERGRYWMLPYDEVLSPPLAEEDLDWARGRLREAGREV